MKNIDYKLIEALNAVISTGSFEKGAMKLCISQSAISQRIKQLEKYISHPVLVRESPPRATKIGHKLLGLLQRVKMLEGDVLPNLNIEETNKAIPIDIATNADSLATWLLPSLQDILEKESVEFNFTVLSEQRTLDKLKNGEVIGAISTIDKTIAGCESIFLGYLEYICVSSPKFYQKHFHKGVNNSSLLKAPTVTYDEFDKIHHDFLSEHYNVNDIEIVHKVANSEAFVKLAKMGTAYCLIPVLQIAYELKTGELINISSSLRSRYPIYWHHWQLESPKMKRVTNAIVKYARKELPQG
ncbi:LysR family transcriptional regulator ArgP [Vibrio sp.]|nr:LysR family transcriptional regulator ArgP [Vibrio sp.]